MKKDISRKNFIITTGALLLGSTFFWLKRYANPFNILHGKIVGPNRKMGHVLRKKSKYSNSYKLNSKYSSLKVETLIIGSGISGLSAGWYLQKNGYQDYKIVELEKFTGGNSSSGKDPVTKTQYPWAAHYLPYPTKESKYVRELLSEMGIMNKGKVPPEYLAQEPKERLFLYGRWQDGLFPKLGANKSDLAQYTRFKKQMRYYQTLIGKDKRKAFAIPLELSSQDKSLLQLDSISMKQFLHDNSYTSRRLHWYVEYATRDDYGSDLQLTSAWAGIHYFAGRPPNDDVLVWPEGNGFFSKYLSYKSANKIILGNMAIHIEKKTNGFETILIDEHGQQTKVVSKYIIGAIPMFTLPYLFSNQFKKETRQLLSIIKPKYSPWMIANLRLKPNSISNEGGTGDKQMYWDNVIYTAKGLGYINAQHQEFGKNNRGSNITWYRAFSDKNILKNRLWMYSCNHEKATQEVIKDLSLAHPNIESQVENIDFFMWAHAMIRPTPGFRQRTLTMNTNQIFDKQRVFLAHSDYSGISIFEQAQYQGVMAAKKVLSPLV